MGKFLFILMILFSVLCFCFPGLYRFLAFYSVTKGKYVGRTSDITIRVVFGLFLVILLSIMYQNWAKI
jgi:hypothetical protein